jgi:hypothetical protein
MAARASRRSVLFAWFLLALAAAAASAPRVQSAQDTLVSHGHLSELWRPPADLAGRDLFYGPGGRDRAPAVNGAYAFVSYKTSGTNPGYHVRDALGRRWSVKLTEEAQSEVFVSRVLWAIGFHQPATYYLAEWTLTGRDEGPKPPGRFRLEPPASKVVGEWSWYDNPFIGTQPFGGLIVAQLIFNNWDLKKMNNKIYSPLDESAGHGRAYVVRDLGGSLGRSGQFPLFKWLRIRSQQGTKNDVDDFERQDFIERVDGDRIHFVYSGLDERLVRRVSIAEVRWVCGWLSKITERQWHDAFRAAGYDDEVRDRYLRKIREKIAEGLHVSPMPVSQ